MFPRSVRSEGPVGFHQSFARVCALEVSGSLPAKNPRKPKCSWAVFLRNGNDGHIQATADSGGDVFERHTLSCDGVVTGSRCALLQSKQVEASDIRHMRSRPAVVAIA